MAKKKSLSEAVADAVGMFVAFFIEVWFATLFIGAAHSVDHRVPALGFATCIFLGAAIGGVVATCVRPPR